MNQIIDPTYVMGIDPGKNGAIALIHKISYKLDVYDMPDKPILIHKLIASYSRLTSFCVIEDVHSLPRDGHVGAFAFGKNYGMLLGILAANNIFALPLKQAVWKSQLNLSQDKSKSIKKIRDLYPTDVDNFYLKKHDGRAEAALLAHIGIVRFLKH